MKPAIFLGGGHRAGANHPLAACKTEGQEVEPGADGVLGHATCARAQHDGQRQRSTQERAGQRTL